MKTASVRTKIVVPTILLFILSLGASTWLTYRVSRDAMQQAALDSMNLIADSTIKSITAWVGERQSDILLWSDVALFGNIVAVATPAPSMVAEGMELLKRFNRDAPYYETLVLVDRQGNAICSTAPEGSQTFNVAERDYFQQAMTGAVAVSEVIRSKVSDNPVVVVAVPVRVGEKPAGVLLGALDLKSFTDKFVKPVKIGPSGYVFVTDRKGVICSHPDASMVMTTNLASLVFGPEIMEKKNGSMRYIYKDEEVLAAYRTDAVFGWIVVARALAREVMTSTRTIRNLNLLVGLGAILLTTLVLLMLSRSITHTITDLAGVAGLITHGRIAEARQAIAQINRIRRPPRDETGQLWHSMSTMADSLNSLVSQVQQSSVQLVSTATEIEATAREQASVIATFGASTTQVVTAAKQISATSQELSQTMETVKNVAEGTVTLADTGRTGLTGMDSSIRQLAKAAASISDKLAAINVKAGTISMVVTTITKVADQTNLLSLNAAIEAEKAGQYGQGFAVVAREIRRLADQTAVATLDIEHMVKEMQSAVAVGVMEMDKFSGEVGRGTEAMETISRPLVGIIAQVKDLAPKFETVNDGMHAQSQGAQQISQALTQVSKGAVKTAESLRQFNEATAQLRNAAQRLQAEVEKFKV
ncbi:MAG: methyl-accepting chemotaxis protein [Verrucomicrobia bacterium]|nr:methyl-accepting chemotaxis protein [Verrucomicrobiota bacterium]MBU1733634.1 methyl-accepting chemotaxis protein [Verrucomicrobiota bacterium]MBU1857585.1 methyl-accepting chemotaxis protein [Verrucomicrobiota bacterium]